MHLKNSSDEKPIGIRDRLYITWCFRIVNHEFMMKIQIRERQSIRNGLSSYIFAVVSLLKIQRKNETPPVGQRLPSVNNRGNRWLCKKRLPSARKKVNERWNPINEVESPSLNLSSIEQIWHINDEKLYHGNMAHFVFDHFQKRECASTD